MKASYTYITRDSYSRYLQVSFSRSTQPISGTWLKAARNAVQIYDMKLPFKALFFVPLEQVNHFHFTDLPLFFIWRKLSAMASLQNFGPCKGNRIPESGKFLPLKSTECRALESCIPLMIGIRNSLHGFRNPRHEIQNPRQSWIPLHDAKY